MLSRCHFITSLYLVREQIFCCCFWDIDSYLNDNAIAQLSLFWLETWKSDSAAYASNCSLVMLLYWLSWDCFSNTSISKINAENYIKQWVQLALTMNWTSITFWYESVDRECCYLAVFKTFAITLSPKRMHEFLWNFAFRYFLTLSDYVFVFIFFIFLCKLHDEWQCYAAFCAIIATSPSTEYHWTWG